MNTKKEKIGQYAKEGLKPWQTLSIERPFVTQWLTLRQDRVLTHLESEISYTFLEHPGAVAIVPVTSSGEIVLLRQYRYAVNDWCWEVPAGSREEYNDEFIAQKELKEEIGGTCQTLIYIGAFYASNGVSNEQVKVFLATDVKMEESTPEHSELLDVRVLPYEEALQMAHLGQISDGPSALALLLCEPYIRSMLKSVP